MCVKNVLDDNGSPFLEVLFGDDTFQPYAYGKSPLKGKNAVGFSDAEKMRLNFFSDAVEKAERDAEQAEAKKNEVTREKPKMSKGARNRANKAYVRLEREQSRVRSTRGQPVTNNHGADSSKGHVGVTYHKDKNGNQQERVQRWPPASAELLHQTEEIDPPLAQTRGFKREREGDHTRNPAKWVEVEA
jgi:hypothetical protein